MAEPVSLVRRGGEFPECTPRHGSLGRSAAVLLPYWIQALLTTQLRTLLDGNREWLGPRVKANGQDWSPLFKFKADEHHERVGRAASGNSLPPWTSFGGASVTEPATDHQGELLLADI